MPSIRIKNLESRIMVLVGGIIVLALCFMLHASPVKAQLEIADSYTIADKDAVDGDILVMGDKGLVRATLPQDSKIFGVLVKNPLLAYRNTDQSGEPVVRSGQAQINVTTLDGDIKQGDYITSSEIPGKASKSRQSGYIIGIALDPFTLKDGTQSDYTPKGSRVSQKISTGKINVAIRIEYAEINTARSANRLLEYVNSAFFRNVQEPEKFVVVIRYIGAALVILISFIIGFFTFARSIPKAMEAMGRNPMARASIQFSVMMNIFFTVIIGLVGVVAAVILLRF